MILSNNLKFLLSIVLLLSFSCRKNNKRTNEVKPRVVIKSSTDKNAIKQQLINDYLKIPKFIFKAKDANKYNKYEDFTKLDSLLKIYSIREDISLKEKQLLAIFKFKRYIITSNYDTALNSLKQKTSSTELDNYFCLLNGIGYLLIDETSKAKEYFQKILLQFNTTEVEKNGLCDKYYLVNALMGIKKIEICKNHVQLYEDFYRIGHDEIIREYILNDIEL